MGAFKILRGRPVEAINPWPEDATLISGATALTNAVRNGPDGTHYLLAPGDYGAWSPGFQPRNAKPDGSDPVHVWGQPGVMFTSVTIGSGKFMHFHYITTTGGTYGFSAGSCTDVGFDHCYSVNAAVHGFHFQNDTNCFATWCKAENMNVGFAMGTSSGMTLADCWVENFNGDAVDVFGITGGSFARILVRSPAPDAGHPDSFQFATNYPTSPVTRNTDITITDINFDRNGGSQTNGPCFSSGGDRLTWTNIASFGSNNNGASLADMTDSAINNALFQGYDYATNAVIRSSLSANNSMTDVQSNTQAGDYNADGAPTGSVYTNCTTIPQAADADDRALYLAFLAANPTIPTVAHFAGAGWI